MMALIMVVDIGSNLDGQYQGISHLLEHVLLSFNRLQVKIGIDDYEIYGRTSFETTTYTLICNDTIDNVKKGMYVFKSILNGCYINSCNDFATIKNDVLLEIANSDNNLQEELFGILWYDNIGMPIGDYECVSKISIDKLKHFFDTTYTRSPFRISLISNLNEELCKSIYGKYFKDSCIRKERRTNNKSGQKNVYYWDYEKGIGIYIKMKVYTFFNKSIFDRVVEDICCMLLEELLPGFFDTEIDVYCQKLRYCKNMQFLALEFSGKDKIDKEQIQRKIDEKEFLSLFLNYIINNISQENYDLLKSDYKGYIAQYLPTLDEQIKDVTNNLIFGDAVYDVNLYTKVIDNLELNSIIKKMTDWFI